MRTARTQLGWFKLPRLRVGSAFGAGRTVALAAALLVMLLALGCGAAEPTATPVPPTATPMPPTATPEPPPTATPAPVERANMGLIEPEHEWLVRTDNDEVDLILATPDLAPGTRRFAMVLTDSSGIVAFPVVQVRTYMYPDGAENLETREGPIESARASYYAFPYGTRGIHVTELNFEVPGTWGVEASLPRPDGSTAMVEVIMEVHEQTKSVDLGEVPPLMASRTLEHVDHISELTTGSNWDEDLYQISIPDALQNGKPTVVVFASPAFCTNAVCGPQVEVLSELQDEIQDQVNFVHVDLFVNPREIQGDLSRAMQSPLLEEWGLVSQEWTFVMDDEGKVVGRFENFVPFVELEESVFSAIGSMSGG